MPFFKGSPPGGAFFKEIEMDVVAFKKEMDSICAECAQKGGFPYGDNVQQQWCGSGATDEDIAAAEKRIGAPLPQEVKDACKVFSSVYLTVLYPAGKELDDVQNKAAAIFDEETARNANEGVFEDGLEISHIFPVSEWGVTDQQWNPKKEYCEALDEEDDLRETIVCCGCEESIVRDRFFIHIGHSNYGEVFMDLNPESSNYGALYHTSLNQWLEIFKIADGYLDFLGRLKKSLEEHRQLLLAGEEYWPSQPYA